MAYRSEIERALNEIISDARGQKFQGLAVIHRPTEVAAACSLVSATGTEDSTHTRTDDWTSDGKGDWPCLFDNRDAHED